MQHHTSFVYDYDEQMMAVLQQPRGQPEYRRNRSHSDFLARLCDTSTGGFRSQNALATALETAMIQEGFNTVQQLTLAEAEALVRSYPHNRLTHFIDTD